ncbi:MAG: NAD(P)H-hydrate dehydratase [Candidatus Omnitrophica bacterium]|nr:NAD(P)H-hydrate dehydratase [Candidatus Omnitrophota bacterium]
MVLTKDPLYEKAVGTTLAQRKKMLELFIKNKPGYSMGVTSKSRYWDISKLMRKKHQRDDIYFLMGMSSFKRMTEWEYRKKDNVVHDLLSNFNFIVTEQSGLSLPEFLRQNPKYQEYSGRLKELVIPAQYQAVTSAQVRTHVKEKSSILGLVPEPIRPYIEQNRIYTGLAEYAQGRVALSDRQTFKDYLRNSKESFKRAEGKGQVIQREKEIIRERLEQGGSVSVASIGCGQAVNLAVLQDAFPGEQNIKYTGFDYNPDIIDEAKQIAPGVNFVQRDIIDGDIHGLEGSFDILDLVNVGHEIAIFYGRNSEGRVNPELAELYVKKMFSNIRKMLKPGSHVFVYDGADVSLGEKNKLITIRFKNKETMDSFYVFSREFMPKEILYTVNNNDPYQVTISKEDFVRFLCEYTYIVDDLPRWAVEKEESWQYFSVEKYVEVLTELGFTVRVHNFNLQRQVSRWEKDFEIVTPDESLPKTVLFIEAQLDADTGSKEQAIEEVDAAFLMPEVKPDDYKGSRGRIMVAGGSERYLGAVQLATKAALRSGSGMVYAGIPERLQMLFEPNRFLEVIYALLPHQAKDIFTRSSASLLIDEMKDSKINVLAIGPGLEIKTEETQEMIFQVLKQAEIPVVLDAGALNALAEKPWILRHAWGRTVITPHVGEMARLTGKSTEEVMANRKDVARIFASAYGTVVVLKGDEMNPTLIVSPQGDIAVNTTGNRFMAKAGMGDVLAGCIASFLGQGLSLYEASILGVYAHGLAGDITAQEKERGLLPSDVIEALPQVLKQLWNKREEYISRDKQVSVNAREVKMIAAAYGLELSDEPVEYRGMTSKAAIVNTKNKGKVVIKKSSWDLKGTLWEFELFNYLRNEKGFTDIPKIMLTKEGNPLLHRGGTIFTVYSFDSKGQVRQCGQLTRGMKENTAGFLARLHSATMDKRFAPISGQRITDSIIDFKGVDARQEKMDKEYARLSALPVKQLNKAERLFFDNYQFFKEQSKILKERLSPAYDKLPRAVIHGDIKPENVLYKQERITFIVDWETARVEARVYELMRSLFFDISGDNRVFNIEEIKQWVLSYQRAAEQEGYPLTEEEIKCIPEMLRARFIQQFTWLFKWDSMERIMQDPKEFAFFENMVKAAQILDSQDWKKFTQEIISENKWHPANCIKKWEEAHALIQASSYYSYPKALQISAYPQVKSKKIKTVGIFAPTGNPLHNGHLKLMQAAREVVLPDGKKLDEIAVLVSTKHVEKKIEGIALEDRIMVMETVFEEAVKRREFFPNRFFLVNSGFYADMGKAVKQYYKSMFGQDIETYFVVGKDSMQSTINSAADNDQLYRKNHFIVMDRKGERIEDTPEYQRDPRAAERILSREFILPSYEENISSSVIREDVIQGVSVGRMIPAAVNTFVRETRVWEKNNIFYDVRRRQLEEHLEIKEINAHMKKHSLEYLSAVEQAI